MSIKKLTRYIVLFIVLFAVWIHYTRWMDFENACFIKIVPAYLELSNANIKRALLVLKTAMPADYADVCKYAKTIDPSPSCGGFGGGCFYSNEERKIYITTGQNDLLGTAGVIVHEVCHAKQNQKNGSLNEDECYREDDRVFRFLPVF